MAGLQEDLYGVLTGDDEGRVCRDIPEAACDEQPGNFSAHLFSLSLTKMGDGLSDPKIILTWLLQALGAPAFMAGFLVPIREAGALLPQLFIAAYIRSLGRRNLVWGGGSAVQGLAVVGLGVAGLFLEGVWVGGLILLLLAVFSLARSACSVAYKDVLGKTVTKSARGTVTGTANSLAAGFVLLFGLALASGFLERSLTVVLGALFLAGFLWLTAAAAFLRLKEVPGASEGGRNAFDVALSQIGLLKSDAPLRRFILARAFLMASALSPPFLLMLAAGEGGAFGALGAFVSASALAGFVSSYVWGRLSDRSSRKVLFLAGCLTSLSLLLALLTRHWEAGSGWLLPLWLFVLMIAHQGVRLGRSTHIVDMAGEEKRAAYTALSNTIIGLLLAAGGAFGLLAAYTGPGVVVGIFALMGLAGALSALRLEEVQRD
jgi:hypothetical protein